MSTLNIQISDALQSFVNEQTFLHGFRSNDEYLCDLIGKEAERQQLKSKLLQGANSEVGQTIDSTYFERLRQRING